MIANEKDAPCAESHRGLRATVWVFRTAIFMCHRLAEQSISTTCKVFRRFEPDRPVRRWQCRQGRREQKEGQNVILTRLWSIRTAVCGNPASTTDQAETRQDADTRLSPERKEKGGSCERGKHAHHWWPGCVLEPFQRGGRPYISLRTALYFACKICRSTD